MCLATFQPKGWKPPTADRPRSGEAKDRAERFGHDMSWATLPTTWWCRSSSRHNRKRWPWTLPVQRCRRARPPTGTDVRFVQRDAPFRPNDRTADPTSRPTSQTAPRSWPSPREPPPARCTRRATSDDHHLAGSTSSSYTKVYRTRAILQRNRSPTDRRLSGQAADAVARLSSSLSLMTHHQASWSPKFAIAGPSRAFRSDPTPANRKNAGPGRLARQIEDRAIAAAHGGQRRISAIGPENRSPALPSGESATRAIINAV